MADRRIVTPYFIGRPVPGLDAEAGAGALTTVLAPPSLGDDDGDDAQGRLIALFEPLAEAIAETMRAGDRPVSIAGDCCSAIGVIAGLHPAGAHPALVWLDAHGDFNTWETTPSGFLGGMPLAMLVGRGETRLPDALGAERLAESRVVLADARDLDPEEAEAVAASDLVHVGSLDRLFDALPDGPLHVHFDSDLISSDDAPGHNYPVPGGPSAEETKQALARLGATGRVASASLSAWNPALDPSGRTADHCRAAFEALLTGRA